MRIPAVALLAFAPALLPGAPFLSAVAPLPLADLKSFFHGEQAAPPKAPRPKATAIVSTAAGVPVDPQIVDFLRAFAVAIQAREGKQMLPRLAEGLDLGNLPHGLNAADLFVLGIDRMAGPTSLVIVAVEKKDTTRVAKVELHYPNQTKAKTLNFAADGKLLSTDLFAVKTQTPPAR